MKKLMFLTVMMLLGSGLTKAFIWQGLQGYEPFSLWNINAPQNNNTVYLVRGQSHDMYINFVTPHDISKLTMDIQFNVMGYPVAGGAFLKYSSEPYRTPMPAKAHQPVEVMANLEILNIIPRISANMEITFKNENGMQIAAGIVRVFFD